MLPDQAQPLLPQNNTIVTACSNAWWALRYSIGASIPAATLGLTFGLVIAFIAARFTSPCIDAANDTQVDLCVGTSKAAWSYGAGIGGGVGGLIGVVGGFFAFYGGATVDRQSSPVKQGFVDAAKTVGEIATLCCPRNRC